jgi:putative flippase GtrA
MNAISIRTLPRPNDTFRQVASFAVIGTVSTAAYVVLYTLLRQALPAAAANALALLLTAVGNTAANRRLTFDVQGRDGLARDHAAGLIALGIALAITTASVAVMDAVAPNRGRLLEIAVLVGANAAATLVRFLLLRSALDRRSPAVPGPSAAATLSAMKSRHA